jgi:hypothetical protein
VGSNPTLVSFFCSFYLSTFSSFFRRESCITLRAKLIFKINTVTITALICFKDPRSGRLSLKEVHAPDVQLDLLARRYIETNVPSGKLGCRYIRRVCLLAMDG